MKKMFSLLLFGVTMILAYILFTNISGIVRTSQETIEFNETTTFDLNVTDETSYYLMTNNQLLSSNLCYITNTDTESSYYCDYTMSNILNQDGGLSISVLNNETNQVHYIQDMGNTSITSNDYDAIGKISLEQGTYTVTATIDIESSYASFKLENSQLIKYILVTVFSAIGFIGSLIGAILLLSLSKLNTQSLDSQLDYYDRQIERQDHTVDLYDDDDPFSKYDLE